MRVTRVDARDVAIETHAPVDLRPVEQADVGSKLLGYIDAVLVDRGDVVRRGQLVAMVRPSDLPDQLTAARGTLAQVDASVALAKASVERANRLAPNGLISKAEVDAAEAQLQSTQAGRASAEAQIAAIGTRLGETRIESPMNGVVLVRRLDPGALVGPPGGGAIVTVARTDVLRVFVSVKEREAGAVMLGQPASVEVDAVPGRTFVGKVTRISPAFDAATRTLEAEVRIANDDGVLRPGMYGRGAIELSRHPNAAVIPVEGLILSAQKAYAFVLNGTKVSRRAIELGYDGGNWLEVTKGLSPGDEIVVAGADGLADGAEVRVARPEAPAPSASASAAPAASATAGKP